MTIRLQSMYECQVKPILTSYRSRKKGSKSSPGMTPQKNQKKRVMPTRGSSNANSPRKNPVRSAATKNPYLQYENGASSDDDHHDDERKQATRRSSNGDRAQGTSSSRKLRSRNSTTTSSSTNRSVNGHSSRNGGSPPNSSKATRRVKRFRISSGESLHSHRSNGRGQRQQTRSARVASSGSGGVHKRAYVEDEGSDEFEGSDDVPMPHLHTNDSDVNYESNSDHEASRGSLRRSSRVQNQAGTRRQRIYEDNDSDEHAYGKGV